MVGRLLRLCGLSLLVYWIVFGGLVDRPLSLEVLRLEMLQKSARLAALPSPKLVILAGSNGPYSHSCVVLRAMLQMPCENAGIAVGIGLDEIFLRYEPFLYRGDVVYMPMELQQYTATAGSYRAAVDGAFLLRHDRGLLAALPWPRVVGAAFCCSVADLMEALVEMPLDWRRGFDPAQLLSGEYNQQGDRIDNNFAARDAALLAQVPRMAPAAQDVSAGYGAALIEAFVAQESHKGVIVIGGLPVDYASSVRTPAVLSAIAAIYVAHGGFFTVLQNRSEYDRVDFFNSEDHLAKPCQYLHSIFVAQRLSELLNRPLLPLPGQMRAIASECPAEPD